MRESYFKAFHTMLELITSYCILDLTIPETIHINYCVSHPTFDKLLNMSPQKSISVLNINLLHNMYRRPISLDDITQFSTAKNTTYPQVFLKRVMV